MYVIKMNDDKSLSSTIKATIYQYERNADTLVFLIPMSYDNVNFADCTMLLRYILPDGTGKSEELSMEPQPYKNYYRFHLKLSSTFTNTAGKIELWLSAINMYDNLVLRTGEAYVNIEPSKDISEYFTDNDKNQLERLGARIILLEQSKADGITYDETENSLQLTANGAPIGDKIDMEYVSNDVIEDSSGDLGGEEEDGSGSEDAENDSDDVIHF